MPPINRPDKLVTDCDHYKVVSGNDGPWTCVACGAVDPPRPKYEAARPLADGDMVERACRAFEAKAKAIYAAKCEIEEHNPGIDEMDDEHRASFYACIGAALEAAGIHKEEAERERDAMRITLKKVAAHPALRNALREEVDGHLVK